MRLLSVLSAAVAFILTVCQTNADTSRFFQIDYASPIEKLEQTGPVSLSWVPADYNVPQDPVSITLKQESPVKIAAPRNDRESFQILVHPEIPLDDLKVEVTDLVGPDGTLFPAENLSVRYAFYHHVTQPTDESTVEGWYPDALVPLEKGSDGRGAPLKVGKDKIQPIWITAAVPSGIPAGLYTGKIHIYDPNSNFKASFPWSLEVWDIDLPETPRFQSAYGFSASSVFQVHRCKTPEERAKILDRYLKLFSANRISPYNPFVLRPFIVTWHPETTPPSCDIDFSEFDKEAKRVLETYHFTSFRLPAIGLGGGTFFSSRKGSILQYESGTPEYESMFTDYMSKLQTHLDELGILDKAYFYWFDEPEPKDYELVADGFSLLKRTGSQISRMLTEEPNDELCSLLDQKNGDINIWCPISNNYSEGEAAKRLAKGERFWWYVCCGPKSPYCTEFLDHPAHELRTWLWQTYERGITGTLIWETVYWTSTTAYPKEPQNPYLDPMSYVVGQGLKPGERMPWGNGDGRFLYPPLSASVPGGDSEELIDEDPVSSIRFEELREGYEDVELLLTLRGLLDAKASQLTPKERAEYESLFDFTPITQTMTEFAETPEPILERRKAVAAAILKLR